MQRVGGGTCFLKILCQIEGDTIVDPAMTAPEVPATPRKKSLRLMVMFQLLEEECRICRSGMRGVGEEKLKECEFVGAWIAALGLAPLS